MCTGVIGHCQCLRCVDHPAPGKLLRVDFCPEQQNKLAGVWVKKASSGHDHKVAACDKLTFKRVGEPGACHFKDADIKMQDADTEMKNVVDTPSGSGSVSGPGIAFTPINAAAIAQAALSIADNADNISQAQEDKAAATAGDNDRHNTMNTNKATPTTGLSNPDNDNDSDMTQEQENPSSTSTSATPNNNKKPPTLTLTQPQIQTNNTTTNTTTTNTTNNNTAPKPAAVPQTPTKPRTPQPDSRPRTPRVAKATADALAAEAAARAARGEWTHAETIKLLLLRVKEVGLEEEDVIGRVSLFSFFLLFLALSFFLFGLCCGVVCCVFFLCSFLPSFVWVCVCVCDLDKVVC
jgi:hypothetical protein